MAASFYASLPDAPREDALQAYLDFLADRNGSLDTEAPFPLREAWMTESEGWKVRYAGRLDPQQFERGFTGQKTDPSDLALQALVAFARMNAGEAYGVEVVGRIRHGGPPPTSDRFSRVERLLGNEETYHTRILLGATRQFDVPTPTSAYRPSFVLKTLITSLAYSPKAIFHPILLSSELAGVFLFNWVLGRVGEVFKDQPELAESLERRLLEVLIDEVGHVAFNRMAVGPTGLSVARKLGPQIVESMMRTMPELRALGWKRSHLADFERTDLASFPEEVRRRSFFV